MQIAPDFDASDWRKLQLEAADSPDWEVAVATFDRRIRARYIDPTDLLIATENDKPANQRRFGFTVLAIDCLLVETIGAFLDGLENTEGVSKKIFCKFLTSRPQFSNAFTQQLAEQFYREFRCGVLHQAEVVGSGRVWSVGPLIKNVDSSLIVNRNMFHECLKAEFDRYLLELRTPENKVLRFNFRKKMNFIARV